VVAPVRLGGIEPGLVFIPFHYGDDGTDDAPSAANRLTLSGWDPVSKQPYFKYAAVRVRPLGTAPLPEPTLAGQRDEPRPAEAVR
jgi:ferredoxin-nitrate reductase